MDHARMLNQSLLSLLRCATESDVEAALKGVLFDLPPTTAPELVEFYNRMLDVMTADSDRAMAMDHARVMSASVWVRPGSD